MCDSQSASDSLVYLILTFSGIISQSPNFTDRFLTVCLSYDPQQNITSGFLGYRSTANFPEIDDLLLTIIKRAARYAFHPLLLPILIQRLWYFILHKNYSKAFNDLWHVQFDTGQMKDYFHKHYAKETIPELIDFNKVHARIVEQHTDLTTDLSRFVEQADAVLLRALDEIDDEWLYNSRNIHAAHHQDL